MKFKSSLVAGIVTTLLALPAWAQKEAKMNEEFFNAITQGNLPKVQEMLKTDSGLASARDRHGLSAILKATYSRQKEIVTLLLNATPELNIFEAAATGQTDRMRALIKQDASLVNAYAADGFFPLGLAVFFGHAESVQVLLSAGADVNAVSREAMQVRPLNAATAARQTTIARLLLAHGADVNSRAGNNGTPLHEAAGKGDLEFAKLLLDHGADINAKTTDNKTPLSFALERNRIEMAEFLRKRGAAE